MNKRIIIVGPSASGKTFLRKKFEDKGFTFDVSYTSRLMRMGEKQGVHYNFISKDEFAFRISRQAYYEYVEYNGNYYGTGMYEWDNSDCFIMETDGIKSIKPEDRKSCFIIYLNPSSFIRIKRMMGERKWDQQEVDDRLASDDKKFKDFKDYDIIITNSNF